MFQDLKQPEIRIFENTNSPVKPPRRSAPQHWRLFAGSAAILAFGFAAGMSFTHRGTPNDAPAADSTLAMDVVGISSGIQRPLRPTDESLNRLRSANRSSLPTSSISAHVPNFIGFQRRPQPESQPQMMPARPPRTMPVTHAPAMPQTPLSRPPASGSFADLGRTTLSGPANRFHLINHWMAAPRTITGLGLEPRSAAKPVAQPMPIRVAASPVQNRMTNAIGRTPATMLVAQSPQAAEPTQPSLVAPIGQGAPNLFSDARAVDAVTEESSAPDFPWIILALVFLIAAILGAAALGRLGYQWRSPVMLMPAISLLIATTAGWLYFVAPSDNGHGRSTFLSAAPEKPQARSNAYRPQEEPPLALAPADRVLDAAYGNTPSFGRAAGAHRSPTIPARILQVRSAAPSIVATKNAPRNAPYGKDAHETGLGLKILNDSMISGGIGAGRSQFYNPNGAKTAGSTAPKPAASATEVAAVVHNPFAKASASAGSGLAASSGKVNAAAGGSHSGGAASGGGEDYLPYYGKASEAESDPSVYDISPSTASAENAYSGIISVNDENMNDSPNAATNSMSGGSNTNTTSASGSADGARFMDQSGLPATVTAGQTYEVTITMLNTGESTWTSSGNFGLGSESPHDNVNWALSEVWLDDTDTISPGEERVFTFPVTAPSTPGTYNFQWRMRDGAQSFGDLSPNLTVQVVAP